VAEAGTGRRALLEAAAALGVVGAAWLAACAAPPDAVAPSDNEDADRLWPAPPELPRYAWETDLRSAADVFEDSDQARRQRLLTGERLPTESVFDKPAAVAARQGRIYVADTVRRRVVVFDVPRRKLFALGMRPPGTLVKPNALALDAQGLLYVADSSLRKVLVYDGLGLHLRSLGHERELLRPTGVAVDSSGARVYVIDRADNDSEQHRVLVYDAQGQLLRQIGQRGSGPGQFNIPVQGAVAPDGTLWVLDAGNFRVQAFDPEGRYLRAFGKAGTALGSFARPRGLACDLDGNLYVSDGAFGNVQVFNPQGQLLITLGKGGRRDAPGRYGLAHGVGVDETGRVYVVDQLFNKVEVLRGRSRGARLGGRGGPGPALSRPWAKAGLRSRRFTSRWPACGRWRP
jgi:DNA-binding beta-propeller fold protein YncE